MEQLRRIVDAADTPAGRAFDWTVKALILLSLGSFSIETLPELDPSWRAILRQVEIVTVGLFTLEYLLRVVVAERRLGFVTSFFGLVDLAAILPFYLSTGLDLRALRAVRLLRVFRALKLVRYGPALRRYERALVIAREELVLFLSAAAVVIFVAAVGIYYFERQAQPEAFGSVFHALWWAIVTLTTVGYGDVYPVTIGGRVFTGLVLFTGLGVVAVPSGLLASALTQARHEESVRLARDAEERRSEE